MTVYQNCKVSDVKSVSVQSSDAGYGYGFSILSEKNRPLVTLSFETQGEAEQARAEIARAVEKAVEVTPQGRPRAARPPAFARFALAAIVRPSCAGALRVSRFLCSS
jgi:hypothetical protein